MKGFLIFSSFLFMLLGCATTVEVPEVSMADGSQNPNEAWKEVLATYVDNRGKVDFVALKENPSKLRIYLNYIAKNSPTTTPDRFPTEESKLAFYLNSYNAIAMYNMIDGEIPMNLSTAKLQSKYFYFRKFVIGGQVMSLYQYENEVIRKVGEERVHFALNCMSGGCPRLPNYPFPAKGLKAELEKQAQFFFNETRNVQVDRSEKTVRFSEIMKWYAEDFLKRSPNVIAYANQYRKEKIPAGFKVEYIPYDWTTNRQTRGTAANTPTTN